MVLKGALSAAPKEASSREWQFALLLAGVVSIEERTTRLLALFAVYPER
jgi:hypothetical protein